MHLPCCPPSRSRTSAPCTAGSTCLGREREREGGGQSVRHGARPRVTPAGWAEGHVRTSGHALRASALMTVCQATITHTWTTPAPDQLTASSPCTLTHTVRFALSALTNPRPRCYMRAGCPLPALLRPPRPARASPHSALLALPLFQPYHARRLLVSPPSYPRWCAPPCPPAGWPTPSTRG